MGARYLIDQFTQDVLAVHAEVDFPINGMFVVRIPDGVQVKHGGSPTLTDINTQKADGLLANNPQYDHIYFEDMLDATGLDPAASSEWQSGDNLTNALLAVPGGQITTNLIDLVGLGGAATDELMLIWELFEYQIDEAVPGEVRKLYSELPDSALDVEVSNDNGVSWTPAVSEANTILPASDSNVLVRFTNTAGTDKIWIGSLAVLF